MRIILRVLVPLGFAVCAVAAPPDPTMLNVDEIPAAEGFSEGVRIKRFNGALSRMNFVTYAKGTLLEMHNHATEQILYLQSGRYRVTVEGVDYLMGAGDVIVFPSYSLHEIEALEDSAHIATFAPGALPE